MKIFPAMDLWEGRVVRLRQGQFDQKTKYTIDPLEALAAFEEQGADYVHVVDLQGAKEGVPKQTELLQSVIRSTRLKVQIGSGFRTINEIERALDFGAFRVVLGTAALENSTLLSEVLNRFGPRITVAMDVLQEQIMVKGWTTTGLGNPEVWLQQLKEKGVESVLCSDISRDGLMQGSNLHMYRRYSTIFPGGIIASGGIHHLEEVRTLLSLPQEGMIIGKALYDGHINLSDIVKLQKEVRSC